MKPMTWMILLVAMALAAVWLVNRSIDARRADEARIQRELGR